MTNGVTRRTVLKAAGLGAVAGATLGTVTEADASPTPTASRDPGHQSEAPSGTITGDRKGNQLVSVRPDGAGAEALAATPTIRHRTFRRGDRVVIEMDANGDVLATPLFLSLNGTIERRSDHGITVDGYECLVDNRSVMYTGRGTRRAVGRLNARNLETGSNVGLLCIQNVIDETLTVQAAYFGA